MIQIFVILFLLLLFVVPAVIWLYFYFSKYYSCPVCGEKILKTERKCPKDKSSLQELEKADKKALRVAHAYRDGTKQFLYDGEKPEDFERKMKEK